MEIKLTADWIFELCDEIYFTKGKGIIIMYDYNLEYRLIELALNTLKVKYDTDDWYEQLDNGSRYNIFEFRLENIEEIKDSCPKLYDKFKNTVINFDD